MIQLNGLSKHYGSVKAVDELSLSIKKGEIFGLLGPNGAGKTTTILMLLGLVEPSGGSLKVCGLNPTTQPIAVKQKVAYMPDSLGFYEDLTAKENLRYIARLSGKSDHEVEKALEWVGLSEVKDKKTQTFSRGMKQRLGLADVLLRDPEVIIMDEPTLGIDPEGVRDFLNRIRSLSMDHGKTILLSSHHLHQVQQVCDRVGLFVKGKLLASGNLSELRRQLFGTDGSEVHIAFEGSLPSTLPPALRALTAVEQVQVHGQELRILSQENICPLLVNTCVEQGLSITGVHQVEQGLDEIYHQYFERKP
jgi:ABC-2 type transport system ATP-binding protein